MPRLCWKVMRVGGGEFVSDQRPPLLAPHIGLGASFLLCFVHINSPLRAPEIRYNMFYTWSGFLWASYKTALNVALNG